MAIKRSVPTSPLSHKTSAVLLGGFGTRPPEGDTPGFSGEGFLELWTDGEEGIARQWRAHEAYLRELAVRWGIEPAWGRQGDRFFAEAIARGEPTDVDAD